MFAADARALEVAPAVRQGAEGGGGGREGKKEKKEGGEKGRKSRKGRAWVSFNVGVSPHAAPGAARSAVEHRPRRSLPGAAGAAKRLPTGSMPAAGSAGAGGPGCCLPSCSTAGGGGVWGAGEKPPAWVSCGGCGAPPGSAPRLGGPQSSPKAAARPFIASRCRDRGAHPRRGGRACVPGVPPPWRRAKAGRRVLPPAVPSPSPVEASVAGVRAGIPAPAAHGVPLRGGGGGARREGFPRPPGCAGWGAVCVGGGVWGAVGERGSRAVGLPRR